MMYSQKLLSFIFLPLNEGHLNKNPIAIGGANHLQDDRVQQMTACTTQDGELWRQSDNS